MNFRSQPLFFAEAQTPTNVPMPRLSTCTTLLRSILIGLPSGIRARTVVERRVQDSISTLPAQCTRVIAGCFSTSSCNTGVAVVVIANLPLAILLLCVRRRPRCREVLLSALPILTLIPSRNDGAGLDHQHYRPLRRARTMHRALGN